MGPVRRPAPCPPRPPSAGLPPPTHPRPAGVRQAHPDPGVRLRLPPYRRCHLLSDDPAPPPRRVDHPRPARAATAGGAWRLRPAVRAGAGAPGGGRLHHQGTLRRGRSPGRARWTVAKRAETLGRHRRGWDRVGGVGGGAGAGQPPRRQPGGRLLAGGAHPRVGQPVRLLPATRHEDPTTLWTSTRRAAATSDSPTGRGHVDAGVAGAVAPKIGRAGRAQGGSVTS